MAVQSLFLIHPFSILGIFSKFYTYLITLLCVVYILPVIMSVVVCLTMCVITMQKTDQQRDRKHFVTLFGLSNNARSKKYLTGNNFG